MMVAKETGWSEDFILWKLPLLRLLAYEHALLAAAGVWTVPKAPPVNRDRVAALGGYLRQEEFDDAEEWF